MADNLEKFNWPFRCYPVLPLVYDDSLSYYECIGKMREKVNELVAYVQNLEDISNAYTDQQIGALRDYLETELSTSIAEVNADLSGLEAKMNAEDNRLQEEINNLAAEINAVIASIDASVEVKLREYDNYIKDYIASQLIDVKVINYFTGEAVTIQEMFDYLAALHIDNGLTYDEIATRGYSYNQLAQLAATNGGTYQALNRNAATIWPAH